MTDDSLPTEALLDGRYHLHECVGQGGMARVFRAEDMLLNRTVAIKLLREETDGAPPSDRARIEMTVLASLNHPALVTLYDAQLVPGRTEYLVMEYVDGPTLAARIAEGPLPPSEVAGLAADLADALHTVHGAGIVHRDIKPSNVLLSRTPLAGSRSGAKLADFGISVLVDSARITTPGLVIGTAAYLAPEQLRGQAPAPPADIYSLGLVLLEALTGQRAFAEAEGIGVAMARLIETPEVPASLGAEWSTLLARMLAADPGERPTADAVFAVAVDLAAAPSEPARPALPAAAAAAAAAAVGAAAAVAAPAAERSDPPTSPTLVLPAGASRRSARSVPKEAVRRRRRLIGGAVAAAVAASVVTGVWLSGVAGVDPSGGTVDTEQSPTPTPMPTAPASTPEEVVGPVTPAEDAPSEADRKAAEQAAKDAEKEQRKAAEEARKAAEEKGKKEEKGGKGGG